MKPMLAFRYKDQRHKLTYPCHVQPKLNGVRMLYHRGTCQSRSHGQDTELLWSTHRLARLRSLLTNIPSDIVLDGELYRHGWSLQKINSAAALNRLEDTDLTDLLEYHVFDLLIISEPNLSFPDRHAYLTELLCLGNNFCIVPTVNILSQDEAEPLYHRYRLAGYEGMMYRQSSAPYGLSHNCSNKENRWPCLLKRKDWLDDEFECIATEPGEGKYADAVGSLVFSMPNGRTFKAGSGLSDAERYTFVTNPPIGRLVKVRYEMLSDEGVPLKPTIECVLD